MKIYLLTTILFLLIYLPINSAMASTATTATLQSVIDNKNKQESDIEKIFITPKRVPDNYVDPKYNNLEWKTRIKRNMPTWTKEKLFVIKNGQWISLIIIVFVAFMIGRIVRIYAEKLIHLTLQSKGIEAEEKNREKMISPLGIMLAALVWQTLVRFIELPHSILDPLTRAGGVVFAISAILISLNIVEIFSNWFEKLTHDATSTFDNILIPLIQKGVKTFVVVVGLIYIGSSLTLDMKGIVAGLGLGGLAFALAAKDTISNLFGSITVLIDRPFSIGDWVIIDNKIEGNIIEVGLRSTKIRTFYDSVISLPNGNLTNVHIDNYGRRTYRRFKTSIGVQYDTPPEKIETFCEAIRQIILSHEHTRKDSFQVYLNNLGTFSLDILIYMFWQVPDWSLELEQRHKLLIDIIKVGKELNIQFAFPTQTLHMFQHKTEQPRTGP